MGNIKFKYDKRFHVLNENESGWGTVLVKISWNGNLPTFNIRNANINAMREGKEEGYVFGKGIALDDELCTELSKALLRAGFLDKEEIDEIIRERESIFMSDTDEKGENKIIIHFKKKVV